jgi:hypothetical protein
VKRECHGPGTALRGQVSARKSSYRIVSDCSLRGGLRLVLSIGTLSELTTRRPQATQMMARADVFWVVRSILVIDDCESLCFSDRNAVPSRRTLYRISWVSEVISLFIAWRDSYIEQTWLLRPYNASAPGKMSRVQVGPGADGFNRSGEFRLKWRSNSKAEPRLLNYNDQ